MNTPDNTRRNRIICDLRDTGMSVSSVAKSLGVTRGVVVGVWHRAGLCKPSPHLRVERDRW